MKENKRYKAVLFDLDGTLIDSKRDIANSIHQLREYYKLPLYNDDDIISNIGFGALYLIEKCLPEINFNKFRTELYKKFDEIYMANLSKETCLYRGVLDFLENYSGFLGIITHKPIKFTLKILENFKIRKYFNVVYGGDQLDFKKPNPWVIENIVSDHNLIKSQTLYAGDSPIDIGLEKNSSITSVACSYGFKPKSELIVENPDYLFESFIDFYDWFKK